MNDIDVAACAQTALGYQFKDVGLLVTSLTHSSIANSRVQSNERLEFLGDSVLGIVVCEELYRRHHNWLEGDLTKVKSVVVSRRTCAVIADEIGLTGLLILGNGVAGRNALPTSLRAAVYESVIGAIFLDGGFEPAREFVLRTILTHLNLAAESQTHQNFKSVLQQHVQKYLSATPRYELLDEQGPDHSKCFEICVVIGHRRFPSAWGPSKKDAEQEAARKAFDLLREEDSPNELNE
ncbi:MAG: ribonuclease III [Planctomycetes bacterium]|nr:ribonuclease III [Planctomycetota bacterium]